MSKTIFIIDDDPVFSFIVEKMMIKVDSTLTIILCKDGKIGLEKIFGHQGDLSECIVLLDINMPVLDGWGFLDQIQSEQFSEYHNIPLYILSSSTDKVDIERSSQHLIVKKFYCKPLSSVDIVEILNFNFNTIQSERF
ncbi:Regulator of RpoS [Flavobacterium sp. CECT 9288]|uniref:response regulator n=1 Tax=Flavobacterium sp. CECT 9288 TaxID=2845819 RepID=UPI001E329B5E|nr:response regulator [Flavobacterium sp. CECT 9288]CAH0336611.1 Regulator of RpoS [Flavobacterium sp. CECT 9288]